MPILPEYLQTIFIAKPPESGWPDEIHIITACNPLSSGERSRDDVYNIALRKTLSQLKVWKHRIQGASPDWKHREKGFAVSGIDLVKAIEIGRRFQQNAIFTVVDDVVSVVSCVSDEKKLMGSFSQRLFCPKDEPRYRIYVIPLRDSVLKVKGFRLANPHHKHGKPCFYVGMTGLTPEERLANHLAGHKDCLLVRDHGENQLAYDLFRDIPLLSRASAVAMEVKHAEYLRSQGYGVWQR
jgi:hypothetical protein